MATTMTIRDAKARLSHLLKRAHDGEEIILSEAGRPYARLVAHRDPFDRILAAQAELE